MPAWATNNAKPTTPQTPQVAPAAVPGGGGGSTTPVNYFEQNILSRSGEVVEALGPTLMGDAINESNGAVEFTHTDVSLPGNSGLPVAIGRHTTIGSRQTPGNTGLFGNWDLDIPHLHSVATATSGTWVGNGTGTPNTNRCSQFQVPPFATAYASTKAYSVSPHQYWDGHHLYVPGSGDQAMLSRSAANTTYPTDGYSYPVVTKQHWQFRCLTTMERGSGEGFLARSPDGSKYQFDHMVTRTHWNFKAAVGALLQRVDVWILPTLVTDRFGNWVRYNWGGADGWQLTSITSSDGRTITLTYYSGTNRAQTVSDATRTWTYGYDANGALQTVTQPDASKWTFDLFQVQRDAQASPDYDCTDQDQLIWDATTRVGTVTHPSGAVGTFSLKMTSHGRSNVPGNQTTCSAALASRYFTNYAIAAKTLTGPGMPSMTWGYQYSAPYGSYAPCNGCVNTKTVTITDPRGDVTVNTFGTQFGINDGLLLGSVVNNGPSTPARTTAYTYRAGNAGPYPYPVGGNASFANSMGVIHTPQSSRVITQQGVTFNQNSLGNDFDFYARLVNVTRSSSLGWSRTETTGYSDQTSLWVMGQVASQTVAGLTASSTSYDASTALPSASSKFGKLQATYGFNADGTLYSITDGLNHATTYTNYYRGIPQKITYADNTFQTAVVNNIGTIDSVTNEAGTTWGFGYDAMGRLNRKTPPTGDPVAYNDTTISFFQVPAPDVGLPANHWRQTITTGNAVTINYFDGRWRKVLTTTYDANNINGTQRTQSFTYDAYNRTTYASYPTRTIADVTAAQPAGTRTSYEVLGRPLLVQQDSELGVLNTTYQYGSAFQRTVTNPRGYASYTSFQVFDEPSESAISTGVSQISTTPGDNVTVTINRDPFGKPSSIVRSGPYQSGTLSAMRSYVYDQYQQLCKTVDPEVGATIQYLDAANNVAWRATGLALTSTSSCDQASVPSAKMAAYTYDLRNRLIGTGFGDGNPSIGRSYAPDGLLSTVVSNGTTWTYSYNNRRLLTKESFNFNGSFDIGWSVNANGHASQLTYPDGAVLAYSPNALGEATQAGSYATGVSYYPNGAVAGYTLGNGIAHSVSQNTRGLTSRVTDSGVAQDSYTYDQNANVASITDEVGPASRTMTYDGLDRLYTANSPNVWGNASYTYDPLSNVRTSVVGTRNSTHYYDANNRLYSIGTNGVYTGYSYDAQGNVNGRGALGLYFDLANRLSFANGVASYAYDGHGRRTASYGSNGLNKYPVYSQGGQLLYERRFQGMSSWQTRYVYLAGKLVASVDTSAGTIYQHTDGLGSPVATTNASAVVATRTRYEPYGKTWTGTDPQGPGFTGHVNDSDTGLVYMQQRYYDPIAARFMSVDPIVTEASTGKGFNLYEYANNNPYRYTDPDGREGQDGATTRKLSAPTGSHINATATLSSTGDILSTTNVGMSSGSSGLVVSQLSGSATSTSSTDGSADSLNGRQLAGGRGPAQPSPQTALETAIIRGDMQQIRTLLEAGETIEGKVLEKSIGTRAGNLVNEFKEAGRGAGARSGQHGTPYKQAGSQLVREGNVVGGEVGKAMKEAGLRFIQRGNSINH